MISKSCPNNIGKKRRLISIDGKKSTFVVEAEIIREQGPKPHRKLIYLQRLKHSDQRIEYRFTYYMWSTKGHMPDHWTFGQYSLMIPAKDLKWLLGQARKDGWDGF